VPSTPPRYSLSSRVRLTSYDLPRFPSEGLFDRIARATCQAGCLPRKELYESWELARRTRRLFRAGRIVDVAGGHGLLAHTMLLLDDSSPTACVVDPAVPPSAAVLNGALLTVWPRLTGRVAFLAVGIEDVELSRDDVVVSSHACGALADRVIERAIEARARVAVLPCCHDAKTCDAGPLAGWLDRALAVDAMRALRLQRAHYRVWTQTIPSDITPKNRLLLGAPQERAE
jgi:hypothetical protein